mgnify:CR=1 FL=1
MAKSAKKPNGKSLVIVESPAKAKTIGKYLGKDYVIEASIGHVRDLPEGKKQVPKKYQDEEWAYLGVNVKEDFDPIYIVSPDKRTQVKKLKDLAKDASELYLATDEDREGEAISWHLREVLNPKIPVRRMVFHEITKEAVQEALNNLRDIDSNLVRAQETRRILDRLYGFDVSPLLWRKLGGIAKSAGRVQSVAVRMVVERERERMRFIRSEYWDLMGSFAKSEAKAAFDAGLIKVDDARIPNAKDFDSTTGKLKNQNVLLLTEASATELRDDLSKAEFKVADLEEKPYTSKPFAPFTTSTLQQEANRKFRFTARRTMQIAQNLYQNGHITYMRTDSTALSNEALTSARNLVKTQYGDDYLYDSPRVYTNKVRNAQEAHEAIRPAGSSFPLPSELQTQLSNDEFRIYDLIWKRTVASQMKDAKGRRMTLGVEAKTSDGRVARFQASGKTIDFPGYLRAYVEGSDDPNADLADREVVLPDVQVGEVLDCRSLDSKQHFTQPPARYTEASLTRKLEAEGIGRPSTYASIIDTILERNYVTKRATALVPTWNAMAMVNLMEQHLGELVDYKFTARLEDDLDAISRGEADNVGYLRSFYYGDDQDGLKHLVESKLGEIDVRAVCQIELAGPKPENGDMPEMYVRVGKYGPYVEAGENKGRVPDDVAPDEMTYEKAKELIEQAQQADEPLGVCPDTHKPVFMKIGRFGPYVQRGTPDDEDKPENASLLKNMKPEDVDLATALALLSLPRELGAHPTSGDAITALNGRFGPYIKSGDETRSLPEEMSPLTVTLQQAIDLLAQPKQRGRGRAAAKREPLKTFDESPVTGKQVQLLDGRWGPYVTDGETNASLPKAVSQEELTFDQALELLAERAKAPKKKKAKKKAAKKTAKKKTAKKKTAKKKAAKKTAKKKA